MHSTGLPPHRCGCGCCPPATAPRGRQLKGTISSRIRPGTGIAGSRTMTRLGLLLLTLTTAFGTPACVMGEDICEKDCGLYGRCSHSDNTCAAVSDEDCRHSQVCRVSGSCSVNGGQCTALTVADCAFDLDCGPGSPCKVDKGVCVPDCAQRPECKAKGGCSHVGSFGKCEPGSDDDCSQSDSCAQEGLCSFPQDNQGLRCAATADSQCASSTGCALHGRCYAFEGKCVTAFDPVCLNRPECVNKGACTIWLQSACQVGCSAECRASEGCRQNGACTAERILCLHDDSWCVPGVRCMASSDQDCLASLGCATAGNFRYNGSSERDTTGPRSQYACSRSVS